MTLSIVYPNPYIPGGVVLLTPTGELPLQDVAQKDVPANTPYLFIDTDTDLPPDFDFFEAWEADFSNPDGEGIGADAWFAAQPPEEPERGRFSSAPEFQP